MTQILTHVVCKAFGDDTISEIDPLQERVAGEVVNALFWRSATKMETSRFIVAMPEGLEPVADSMGRFWSDLDMLHKAGREAIDVELVADKLPSARTSSDWALDIDPDDEKLNFNDLVKHGFPLPAKVSERRYQLWNGEIVVGSFTEAGEQHFAGVRARIRELRAEHLVPAAGSATDN